MANKYKITNSQTENSGKASDKKTLAVLLLLSFVFVLTVYFSFVKQGLLWIVYVYWALFVILAIAYALFARLLALEKLKKDAQSTKLSKYEKGVKGCLLILFPVIVSLLADYMILNLGLAKYLGI